MHFCDPVPQRIGDELQYVRLTNVDGVAAAGEVAVVPPVPQSVVGAVVDAAKAQCGTGFVPFGGVVVDDVEDDLEPCGVQGAHQLLELGDLFAAGAARRVRAMRGEVAQRVVAPVVDETVLKQAWLRRKVVHRGEAPLP